MDKIKIAALAEGFELMASEVIRNGQNLGSYRAAKNGGIATIILR